MIGLKITAISMISFLFTISFLKAVFDHLQKSLEKNKQAPAKLEEDATPNSLIEVVFFVII